MNSVEKLVVDSGEIAKKAVGAAIEKQAVDILMLDIRKISSVADYFVVCSAESDRQTRAICEEIEKDLRKDGCKIFHREGVEDSGWVLLDFGAVIVHVFNVEQREYYDIEKVWSEAATVVRIQ